MENGQTKELYTKNAKQKGRQNIATEILFKNLGSTFR